MRRLLILLPLVGALLPVGQIEAQIPPANTAAGNGYAYPVLGVAGYHSANFGEMRPDHFHGGIDIKTDGVEGKPLAALDNGYISRVTVTAGGYGRALYLVLNDGRTAVYGHISRFRDDIEALVNAQRHARHSNDAQLTFAPGRFPVRRGEVVARSGNSGASFGPHLHLELREPGGRLLNIIREGIIRPRDNISPVVMRLHYVEVDTLQGVPLHAPRQTYHAALIGGGRYRLLHEGPIETGPKGYFVLEASDRRNGVQNTFGIYRVSLDTDAERLIEYRMDGIPHGFSRYCNAVACYPLQIAVRNEAIRLAQLDQAPDCFYTQVRERGILRTAQGQVRHIRIEAEDDCGNLSTLEFEVCGRSNFDTHPATHTPPAPTLPSGEFLPQTFLAEPDGKLVKLRPERAATLHCGSELTARIPAGALYEPIFCRPERLDTCIGQQIPGVVILSPAYRLLEASTPLHRAITVSLRVAVPAGMQAHTALAVRDRTGKWSCIAGRYADGTLTARTAVGGELRAVADTLPPTVRPLFKQGADLSRTQALRFRAEDNFSGIGEYSLHIDGQWVPCERQPVKGTLYHSFAGPAKGRKHHLELRVSDRCGNTICWTGTFYR